MLGLRDAEHGARLPAALAIPCRRYIARKTSLKTPKGKVRARALARDSAK